MSFDERERRRKARMERRARRRLETGEKPRTLNPEVLKPRRKISENENDREKRRRERRKRRANEREEIEETPKPVSHHPPPSSYSGPVDDKLAKLRREKEKLLKLNEERERKREEERKRRKGEDTSQVEEAKKNEELEKKRKEKEKMRIIEKEKEEEKERRKRERQKRKLEREKLRKVQEKKSVGVRESSPGKSSPKTTSDMIKMLRVAKKVRMKEREKKDQELEEKMRIKNLEIQRRLDLKKKKYGDDSKRKEPSKRNIYENETEEEKRRRLKREERIRKRKEKRGINVEEKSEKELQEEKEKKEKLTPEEKKKRKEERKKREQARILSELKKQRKIEKEQEKIAHKEKLLDRKERIKYMELEYNNIRKGLLKNRAKNRKLREDIRKKVEKRLVKEAQTSYFGTLNDMRDERKEMIITKLGREFVENDNIKIKSEIMAQNIIKARRIKLEMERMTKISARVQMLQDGFSDMVQKLRDLEKKRIKNEAAEFAQVMQMMKVGKKKSKAVKKGKEKKTKHDEDDEFALSSDSDEINESGSDDDLSSDDELPDAVNRKSLLIPKKKLKKHDDLELSSEEEEDKKKKKGKKTILSKFGKKYGKKPTSLKSVPVGGRPRFKRQDTFALSSDSEDELQVSLKIKKKKSRKKKKSSKTKNENGPRSKEIIFTFNYIGKEKQQEMKQVTVSEEDSFQTVYESLDLTMFQNFIFMTNTMPYIEIDNVKQMVDYDNLIVYTTDLELGQGEAVKAEEFKKSNANAFSKPQPKKEPKKSIKSRFGFTSHTEAITFPPTPPKRRLPKKKPDFSKYKNPNRSHPKKPSSISGGRPRKPIPPPKTKHSHGSAAAKNLKTKKEKLYFNNGFYEGQVVYIQSGRTTTIKMHGKGSYFFNNGGKYEGDYNMGVQHGYGTYLFPNNNCYEGQWKNGQIHGKGKYIYKDGSKFVGVFNLGKKHGKGKQYWANGKLRFKGTWENDKKTGWGQMYFQNGATYVGYYKNDQKHGLGREDHPTGGTYFGFFENGRKTKSYLKHALDCCKLTRFHDKFLDAEFRVEHLRTMDGEDLNNTLDKCFGGNENFKQRLLKFFMENQKIIKKMTEC